ncbi:hypothetical protein A8G00_20470 [Sphingobium sp. SA916]|nr:hypothetical protein A8G00_20470 [Sphingobium sp. SA916]
MRQHAFDIPYHVGILKAQDGKAQFATVGVAAGVIFRTVVVGGAIQFDDELRLATEEVREIRADRDLAAELAAVELAVTQALPKEPLRRRCLVS